MHPATMDDGPPDLTGFFLLHRALRADARRLVHRLEGLRITDGEIRRGLVPWFEVYREAAHHHSRVEHGCDELDALIDEQRHALWRLHSGRGVSGVVAARDEAH